MTGGRILELLAPALQHALDSCDVPSPGADPAPAARAGWESLYGPDSLRGHPEFERQIEATDAMTGSARFKRLHVARLDNNVLHAYIETRDYAQLTGDTMTIGCNCNVA